MVQEIYTQTYRKKQKPKTPQNIYSLDWYHCMLPMHEAIALLLACSSFTLSKCSLFLSGMEHISLMWYRQLYHSYGELELSGRGECVVLARTPSSGTESHTPQSDHVIGKRSEPTVSSCQSRFVGYIYICMCQKNLKSP